MTEAQEEIIQALRVHELKEKFGDNVRVIEPNTSFYHESDNPQSLIQSEMFDPTKSRANGDVFFTDAPNDEMTNIEATNGRALVLCDLTGENRQKVEDDLKALTPGERGYRKAAIQAGFDGFILEGDTIYVKRDSEGKKGKEYQIFKDATTAFARRIKGFSKVLTP